MTMTHDSLETIGVNVDPRRGYRDVLGPDAPHHGPRCRRTRTGSGPRRRSTGTYAAYNGEVPRQSPLDTLVLCR
jgi:hypothetical protein